MKCTAYGQPSDQLRHIERHRRSGFGYRTSRASLCPTCAPAPVAPAGASLPPVDTSPGAGAGAVLDPNAPTGAVVAAGGGSHPSNPIACTNTEGPNHEVAVGDGAVIPARICAPLGMCPGSNSGPGYTSPGGMVGRADSGRAV